MAQLRNSSCIGSCACHLLMCMSSLCRTKTLSSLVRVVEMSRLRTQTSLDSMRLVRTSSCMDVRTVYAALLVQCDRWLPLPMWQVCPDMLWQWRNIGTLAQTSARLTFIVVSKCLLHRLTVLCSSCCHAYWSSGYVSATNIRALCLDTIFMYT